MQLTGMHEIALPAYLAHDLEVWENGVEENSRILECPFVDGRRNPRELEA